MLETIFSDVDLRLARKSRHVRGATLGLRYYKAFVSLKNTESIRLVAE